MAAEAMVVSEVPAGLRELGDQPYEFLNGQLTKKESVGRLQHSHLGKKEWAVLDVTLAFPDSVIQEGFVLAPVQLVVESVSTEQRHNKLFQKCFDIYHPWRIPYCWVVDPDEGSAYEVHRDWGGLIRPTRILTAGGEIRLDLRTILDELEAELHPF